MSIYTGVNGLARKVKGLFVGVDGVARNVVKAYVGVDGKAKLCYEAGNTSRLPAGYTEVEYIETSGACRIDTGVQPTKTMRFWVDFYMTTIQTSAKNVFYARYPATGNTITSVFSLTFSKSGISVKSGPSGSTSKLSSSAAVGRKSVIVDLFNNQAYINETGSTIVAVNRNINTPSSTLTLFNTTSGTSASYQRLYWFGIYNNNVNVPIHYFIPCKTPSGVVGLYDIKTNTFCRNSGSGSLVAGPEV